MHRTDMVSAERPRRVEWEAQYVSEYVATRYPRTPVRLHVRLGTPPVSTIDRPLTAEEERVFRYRMRWADAVVFTPEETIVIEGKLRAAEYAKAIGELEIYMSLVQYTPEFKELLAPRIVGELLIPGQDPTVETVARRKGYRVVVWAPSWIENFRRAVPPRFSRPVRPEEAGLL